jgi:hypothetical protein
LVRVLSSQLLGIHNSPTNMEKNSMAQPSWCIADLDEKGPALEGIETDDWTWSDLKQFQGQNFDPQNLIVML